MRAILTALCLTIASQAGAEISGSMSCKVKSNRVTALEEGKTIFYSGAEDGFVKGDTLTLKYKFIPGAQLFFTLKDGKTNPDNPYANILYESSLFATFAKEEGRIHMRGKETRNLSFSEDFITISNVFQTLKLRRYYKGDFHGYYLYQNISDLWVQLATFDCRPIDDKLSEIISSF